MKLGSPQEQAAGVGGFFLSQVPSFLARSSLSTLPSIPAANAVRLSGALGGWAAASQVRCSSVSGSIRGSPTKSASSGVTRGSAAHSCRFQAASAAAWMVPHPSQPKWSSPSGVVQRPGPNSCHPQAAATSRILLGASAKPLSGSPTNRRLALHTSCRSAPMSYWKEGSTSGRNKGSAVHARNLERPSVILPKIVLSTTLAQGDECGEKVGA